MKLGPAIARADARPRRRRGHRSCTSSDRSIRGVAQDPGPAVAHALSALRRVAGEVGVERVVREGAGKDGGELADLGGGREASRAHPIGAQSRRSIRRCGRRTLVRWQLDERPAGKARGRAAPGRSSDLRAPAGSACDPSARRHRPLRASRRSMRRLAMAGSSPSRSRRTRILGVGDALSLERGDESRAPLATLGGSAACRSSSAAAAWASPSRCPSSPFAPSCRPSAAAGDVFVVRAPGIASRTLLQRREGSVDQLLAELVRLLRVHEEPALGGLARLEPIVRGPITAGRLAGELVGVGRRIGSCALACPRV